MEWHVRTLLALCCLVGVWLPRAAPAGANVGPSIRIDFGQSAFGPASPYDVRLSPDGSRAVWAVGRPTAEPGGFDSELWVSDTATGDTRRVATVPSDGVWDWDIRLWGLAGTRLLYSRATADGGTDLVVHDLDGGADTIVCSDDRLGPLVQCEGTISANGRFVVSQLVERDTNPTLTVHNLVTGWEHRLRLPDRRLVLIDWGLGPRDTISPSGTTVLLRDVVYLPDGSEQDTFERFDRRTGQLSRLPLDVDAGVRAISAGLNRAIVFGNDANWYETDLTSGRTTPLSMPDGFWASAASPGLDSLALQQVVSLTGDSVHTATVAPDGRPIGPPWDPFVRGLSADGAVAAVLASNQDRNGPGAAFIVHYDPSPPTAPAALTAVVAPGSLVSRSGRLKVDLGWDEPDVICRFDVEGAAGEEPPRPVSHPGVAADSRSSYLRLAAGPFSYRVSATDCEGDRSGATGESFQLSVLQERADSIVYRGGWRHARRTWFDGGGAMSSRAAGASATVSFVGSSVALVSATGPRLGALRLYLDGRPAGRVRLTGPRRHRAIVFTRALSSPGEHRLRIVAVGARPVPLDAVAVVS